MSNLDTLIAAGVVPQDHTLTQEDIQTIEKLTVDEVKTLVDLSVKLGADFIQRNLIDAPNCFL